MFCAKRPKSVRFFHSSLFYISTARRATGRARRMSSFQGVPAGALLSPLRRNKNENKLLTLLSSETIPRYGTCYSKATTMMSEGTPPGYETREEKMAASNHDAAAAMGGEEIYQFLDPLDPRRVSLEIFELYCHEMISTPIVGRRAYLIKKMRVSHFDKVVRFCVFFISNNYQFN